MDRQIKAERAWLIPYKIFSITGANDITALGKINEARYVKIFNREKLHRFNNDMASVFYNGVQKIKRDYQGNAALIWSGEPGSATVVSRFLEFHGAGIKIANMAANALARKYKIRFSDYSAIDISPDVHVRRVMWRLGYVPKNAGNAQVIYKARELHPEYPGIIDNLLWKVGMDWCHPSNPDCRRCLIREACKK
jgi:endonuclease III